MNLADVRGILPPVPTPFDDKGDLDPTALAATVAAILPEVDGVVVLGSNGEAVYLERDERDIALRAAREVVPAGTPLIAGTGAESTRATVVNTVAAAAAGADLALVLPPHYFKGQMTDRALERHYRAVADTSPIPLLLYNIPTVTTLRLTPGLIARLAEHPNIVGIKDSSGDIGAMTEIVHTVPSDFVVLTGNAPTLLPALALGARGGILAVANVAPRAYKDLYRAFEDGDIARARELQTTFNELALAVTARWGVPGLKAALRLQGRQVGRPRAPLLDVTTEVETELRTLLSRLALMGG